MRVVIDLDGTICEIKGDTQSYADVCPLPGAVSRIQELKNNGYYIIIQTARHMKTCDGNVGLVMAKVAKTTLQWLSENNIPFDEIHFGKPNADVYIDDRAISFSSWEAITLNLLESVAKSK